MAANKQGKNKAKATMSTKKSKKNRNGLKKTKGHQRASKKGVERDTNSETSLLGLPAELRNEIYQLAIAQEAPFILTKKRIEEPALLGTCQQIYREAAPIHYAVNSFRADIKGLDFSLIGRRLHHIGEEFGRTKLERFTFYIANTNKSPNFKQLFGFFKVLVHSGVKVSNPEGEAGLWQYHGKDRELVACLQVAMDICTELWEEDLTEMNWLQEWKQVWKDHYGQFE